MEAEYPKFVIDKVFEQAGITMNGPNSWDPQVLNQATYRRILKDRELGLGEAYMDGWWDCPKIDEFFYYLLRAGLDDSIPKKFLRNKEFLRFGLSWYFYNLPYRLFNYQSLSRAFQVAEAHYDISNELFTHMLDPELNYSCGYWQACDDLASAQNAKLKLICDKLNLKPGQRILDIGCGWGSFARYAARHYGVEVVGVTVSKQQKELAEKLCQKLPIEIRLQDYRELNEQFDNIVSIGMFEHVGYKNYPTFMTIANRCLKDDGLFLLHTIGSNTSGTRTNRWINKYIFPNGMVPSIRQIGSASEGLFVMEDWHNFGADYDKTLMAWYHNFNNNWDVLQKTHTDRFRRMWNYYLLSSAGGFRARYLQLWQVVFSKYGSLGGYKSCR